LQNRKASPGFGSRYILRKLIVLAAFVIRTKCDSSSPAEEVNMMRNLECQSVMENENRAAIRVLSGKTANSVVHAFFLGGGNILIKYEQDRSKQASILKRGYVHPG